MAAEKKKNRFWLKLAGEYRQIHRSIILCLKKRKERTQIHIHLLYVLTCNFYEGVEGREYRNSFLC